jgi:hypothetical protein
MHAEILDRHASGQVRRVHGQVLKTVRTGDSSRGFESHTLRFVISGGEVSFHDAKFCGATVSFRAVQVRVRGRQDGRHRLCSS